MRNFERLYARRISSLKTFTTAMKQVQVYISSGLTSGCSIEICNGVNVVVDSEL